MLTLVIASAGIVAGLLWLTTIRYVALGDSLARGVGSLTFFGYVPRFALYLFRRLKRLVLTTQLGRFGMTSAEMLEALRSDRRFRRAVQRASFLTLNVGGNDLLSCGMDPVCLERAADEFLRNLEAIYQELRTLNPKASLYVLTLYNPIPESDSRHQMADAFIAPINAALTDPALLKRYRVTGVAPVSFAGQECLCSWFCVVGDIHPTDLGYAIIADSLVKVHQESVTARRGLRSS